MQNTQTTKEADTSEQAKVTSSTCPSHTNTQSQQPPGGNIESVSLLIKLI